MVRTVSPYTPRNHVRIVTAASLFDGHDAAINIMRRILRSNGAEVIHVGHNRSVSEIVTAAVQEDAQAIGLSCYQGGHMEYFKYAVDLHREYGAACIEVFGGGGGVIVPAEIRELEAYGVTKIYSPEDGRKLGLQGIINHFMECSDFPTTNGRLHGDTSTLKPTNWRFIANAITQLAFTLANGFTYVEYYLSRGMHIDEFAPNLSFFFSKGLEPEYTVIGRVALSGGNIFEELMETTKYCSLGQISSTLFKVGGQYRRSM